MSPLLLREFFYFMIFHFTFFTLHQENSSKCAGNSTRNSPGSFSECCSKNSSRCLIERSFRVLPDVLYKAVVLIILPAVLICFQSVNTGIYTGKVLKCFSEVPLGKFSRYLQYVPGSSYSFSGLPYEVSREFLGSFEKKTSSNLRWSSSWNFVKVPLAFLLWVLAEIFRSPLKNFSQKSFRDSPKQ